MTGPSGRRARLTTDGKRRAVVAIIEAGKGKPGEERAHSRLGKDCALHAAAWPAPEGVYIDKHGAPLSPRRRERSREVVPARRVRRLGAGRA